MCRKSLRIVFCTALAWYGAVGKLPPHLADDDSQPPSKRLRSSSKDSTDVEDDDNEDFEVEYYSIATEKCYCPLHGFEIQKGAILRSRTDNKIPCFCPTLFEPTLLKAILKVSHEQHINQAILRSWVSHYYESGEIGHVPGTSTKTVLP